MKRLLMISLVIASALGGCRHGGDSEAGQRRIAELTEIRDRLRAQVLRLGQANKVPFGEKGGLSVMQPAEPGGYHGLWPDDWYFPNALVPDLITDGEAAELFAFLTRMIENAAQLPDRVEPNGHLVYQPGLEGRPHGRRMPAHLPAAWLRLVDYLYARTGDRALVERWRGVFERSIAELEIRDGLVWLSTDEPRVGFGFYDTVGLAGHDLMTNLVMERGLRRAEPLFGGDLGRRCTEIASGIRANIHRLRRPYLCRRVTKNRWYLSDTDGCRQFSPWSNGLAYSAAYLPESDRRSIAAAVCGSLPKVVCRGQIRHCPEPWKKMNSMADAPGAGLYMDGGCWAVGTGYVLAAVYDRDPETAVSMLREMLASLERNDFAEWEDADGVHFGARGFLMSVAIPLAAVESVLSGGSLLDLF